MITTSHLFALAFVLLGAIALVIYGIRFRKQVPDTREYPVFRLLANEVGRVAEEGKLIHVTLGGGSLLSEDTITSVAALESLTAFCDLSAAYDTPPIITTGDSTLYLLADDWMRRAYARVGNVARYRPTLVQFMAASPIVYAAMTSSYIHEKGVGANVFLGAFEQEISLMMDAVARRGAHAVGGAVSPQALGALYPTLNDEQLVMGETFFAGGAEVINRSSFWVSLQVQDTLRWLIIFSMVVLAVLSILGLQPGG